MSYKPLYNINSSSDIDETLKNQAINKMIILQESIKDKNIYLQILTHHLQEIIIPVIMIQVFILIHTM